MLATRYTVEVISWHKELPGEIRDLFRTETYSILMSKTLTKYLAIYELSVPVEFGPPDLQEVARLKKHGVIIDLVWSLPTTLRKESFSFPVYDAATLKIEMKEIVNEYIEVHTSDRNFEQFIYTEADA